MRMKKVFLTAFAFAAVLAMLPSAAIVAQQPVDSGATEGAVQSLEMTVVWQSTYASSNATESEPVEKIHDATLLPDGGVAVVGHRRGGWIARFDPSGQLVWERDEVEIRLRSVDAAPDGGLVVGGSEEGVFSYFMPMFEGDYDMYVARLDPEGNMIWDRSIEGGTWDNARRVKATGDLGALVLGLLGNMRDSEGNLQNRTQLLRLGRRGGTEWRTTVAAGRTGVGDMVQLGSDGAVAVVTARQQHGPHDNVWEAYLLTVDEDGELLDPSETVIRSVPYQSPARPAAIVRVEATAENALLIASADLHFSGTSSPVEVVLLSIHGKVLWRTVLPTSMVEPDSPNACSFSMAVLPGGDALLTCPTRSRIKLYRLGRNDGAATNYELALPECQGDAPGELPVAGHVILLPITEGHVLLAGSSRYRRGAGCVWLGRMKLP